MARTEADIQEDLDDVRCAMRAMLSTKDTSVGLRNLVDLVGRQEGGMRPTFAQLQQREKDLIAELARATAGNRGMTIRTRFSKGISS